jgi:hypothetical protein
VSVYRDPMSGEMKKQERKLEFSLTPQRAIKIFRKRSQIGGRMAVSVMTFDSAGEMRNRYTFAEGEASMNFGEEIVRIQDISFKTEAKGGAAKNKAEKGSDDAAEASSEAQPEENASSGAESSF